MSPCPLSRIRDPDRLIFIGFRWPARDGPPQRLNRLLPPRAANVQSEVSLEGAVCEALWWLCIFLVLCFLFIVLMIPTLLDIPADSRISGVIPVILSPVSLHTAATIPSFMSSHRWFVHFRFCPSTTPLAPQLTITQPSPSPRLRLRPSGWGCGPQTVCWSWRCPAGSLWRWTRLWRESGSSVKRPTMTSTTPDRPECETPAQRGDHWLM